MESTAATALQRLKIEPVPNAIKERPRDAANGSQRNQAKDRHVQEGLESSSQNMTKAGTARLDNMDGDDILTQNPQGLDVNNGRLDDPLLNAGTRVEMLPRETSFDSSSILAVASANTSTILSAGSSATKRQSEFRCFEADIDDNEDDEENDENPWPGAGENDGDDKQRSKHSIHKIRSSSNVLPQHKDDDFMRLKKDLQRLKTLGEEPEDSICTPDSRFKKQNPKLNTIERNPITKFKPFTLEKPDCMDSEPPLSKVKQRLDSASTDNNTPEPSEDKIADQSENINEASSPIANPPPKSSPPTPSTSSSSSSSPSFSPARSGAVSNGLPQEEEPSGEEGPTDAYPQLSDAEVSDKLKHLDVVAHSELVDDLRNVGLTSLSKLQHLDKSDPAVRRLFMRPRVTPQEIKNITIDPDIKATVNEFLRMNITGNFVIARVLRENFATFFSWLSTHLQSERNAWAVRLAQALEQAERQRRTNFAREDLVNDCAWRLRHLVQKCSREWSGAAGKPGGHITALSKANVHNLQFRQERSNKPAGGDGVSKEGDSFSSFTEKIDSALQARKDNFHNRLGALSKLSERHHQARLTRSNYNTIKVSESMRENTRFNYESDPGMAVDSSTGGKNKRFKSSDSKNRTTNENIQHSINNNNNSFCDGRWSEIGLSIDKLVADDDENTNWNTVMTDSIDLLDEICDILLTDRSACLCMVGAKPTSGQSLVDAVSMYVQSRDSSSNTKRREIEQRLGRLERENVALQDEMSTLHKTLMEKNNDALNLRQQLTKLELILMQNMAKKVNKCVGTEERFMGRMSNNKTSKSLCNGEKISKSPYLTPMTSKSPYLKTNENQGFKQFMPNTKKFGMNEASAQIIQNGKENDRKREEQTVDGAMIMKDVEFRGGGSEIVSSRSESSVQNVAPLITVREPSLIEISEEKLKTLKERAKKLEDSLHDAISSMDQLKRVAPVSDGDNTLSKSTGRSQRQYGSNNTIRRREERMSQNYGRYKDKHLRAGGSFEVSGTLTGQKCLDFVPTPRLAVIKRTSSFSERRCQSEHPPSSLSVAAEEPDDERGSVDHVAPGNTPRNTPNHFGSSRLSAGKRAVSQTMARSVDFSSDEEFRSSVSTNNARSTVQPNIAPLSTSEQKALQMKKHNQHRVRAVVNRQTVSKCLRCQKIFTGVNNHKLACCYHPKSRERLEHYDETGRLMRVVYAWKCCRGPQESEGCVYGQHV